MTIFYGVVLTEVEFLQVAKGLGIEVGDNCDAYDVQWKLEPLLADLGSFFIPITRESKQAIQNSLRSFDEDMPQTIIDLIAELCGERPPEDRSRCTIRV